MSARLRWRWVRLLLILSWSLGAVGVGTWAYTNAKQSVDNQATAVASTTTSDVAARLVQEFDHVLAGLRFIGLAAFRSPPSALDRADLGRILSQFARASASISGLELVSPSDTVLWHYGNTTALNENAPGARAVFAGESGPHIATGHLFVHHGRLSEVLAIEMLGAHHTLLGVVRGWITLANPVDSRTETIYLTQPNTPTIAIGSHGVVVSPEPANFVPLSVVAPLSERVSLTAGSTSRALSSAVTVAVTGPWIALALIWVFGVGFGLVGIELLAMAERSQARSRQRALRAETSRRLMELVLAHVDLEAMIADIGRLLYDSSEAREVLAVFDPVDAPSWCIDHQGQRCSPLEPVSANALALGRWQEMRSPEENSRVLVASFGGPEVGVGRLIVIEPSVSGSRLLTQLDLSVVDLAIDRARMVSLRRLMAAAVEATDAGIAIFGVGGDFVWANASWYGLLGIDKRQDPEQLRIDHLSSGADGEAIGSYLLECRDNPTEGFACELLLQRADDRAHFWGYLALTPVNEAQADQASHIVALLRDVTASHEVTQDLAYQLDHDALTGALSRSALQTRVESAIDADRAHEYRFAVAIIDIDNFKLVNDTWGHSVGDELLIGFARRLIDHLGEAHAVARLGGDEFIMMLCLDESAIQDCIDSIGTVLAEPFDVGDGLAVMVQASMGIATYPGDAMTLESLLREADLALYHVKSAKSSRPRWWLHSSEVERHEIDDHDPWSPASGARLGRYRALWTTMTASVASELRTRINGEHALPINVDGADWVQLHCELLGEVLDPAATPLSLGDRVASAGAELEVANGDRELLGLTTSLVIGAFLGDEVGLMVNAQERRILIEIIRRRFEWLVEREREAMAGVRASYLAGALGASLSGNDSWDQYLEASLDRVAALPGVRAVIFIEVVDAEGGMPRYLGGALAPELRSWLHNDPGARRMFDFSLQEGPGDGTLAWESYTTVALADVVTMERYRPWAGLIRHLGFRSLVIIPLMVGAEAIGLCIVLGDYTQQFQGPTPEEFVAALQANLQTGWLNYRANVGSLTGQVAQRYRKALLQGGLREHFQPLIELATGRPTRLELLARLEIGAEGLAQPGEFLPAFGERELARLFVDSVVRVCELRERWDEQGLRLGCSINLPGSILLDPRLSLVLEATRRRCDGDLSWLTLELLESEYLDDERSDVVRTLAGDGIAFAIDDLGSGYSNLERLVDFPSAEIKLDRSLIQRLWSHPLSTLGVVGGLIQAGHDSHRRVVFEGVERLEVLEVARVLDADYAQGFVIARPMPANEVASWVTRFQEDPPEIEPLASGRLNSLLGALVFVWREVRQHPEFWVDNSACPVDDFLRRTFGPESSLVVLHRRLHQEGLATSDTYELLIAELERNQRMAVIESGSGYRGVSGAVLGAE